MMMVSLMLIDRVLVMSMMMMMMALTFLCNQALGPTMRPVGPCWLPWPEPLPLVQNCHLAIVIIVIMAIIIIVIMAIIVMLTVVGGAGHVLGEGGEAAHWTSDWRKVALKVK